MLLGGNKEPMVIRLVTNAGTADDNHLRGLQRQFANTKASVKKAFPFWTSIPVEDMFESLYPRADQRGSKVTPQVSWLLSLDPRGLLNGTSDIETIQRLHADLVVPGLISLEARNLTPSRHGDLHAKFFIFDDRLALITSANPTRKGLRANLEVGILTDDAAVLEPLLATWGRVWAEAHPLSLADAGKYNAEVREQQAQADVIAGRMTELTESLQIEPARLVPNSLAPTTSGVQAFQGVRPEWFDHLRSGQPRGQALCPDLPPGLRYRTGQYRGASRVRGVQAE